MRAIAVMLLALAAGSVAVRAQPYTIRTVAGTSRFLQNVPATQTILPSPRGLAVDGSGNVFLSDEADNLLRLITPDGRIRIVAGTLDGGFAGDGGPVASASFNVPTGLAVDASANLYVADYDNQRVRRITPAGIVSTVVGNGNIGASGDNGPATSAGLDPFAVAVDNAGNLYIADRVNHRVRRVDTAGIITTIAGTGSRGFSGDNGPAAQARLDEPIAVLVDRSGVVYVAEEGNDRIRRITADGIITTVMGSGVLEAAGDGGPATQAAGDPVALALGPDNALYFADEFNHRVRRIAPDGIITTVAGTGVSGNTGDGGPAAQATLSSPVNVALDAQGNLLVADAGNRLLRAVSLSSGTIRTVAGARLAENVPATAALLFAPTAVLPEPDGAVLISDQRQSAVRRIAANGVISTVAGTGSFGTSGDNGPATRAQLETPDGLARDAAGNIYVADFNGAVVRRVSPQGVITTVAGQAGQSTNTSAPGDGGPATRAVLGQPAGLALDAAGALYIADIGQNRVRRVGVDGVITTVAGNGTSRASGDGGPATSAGVSPFDVSADAQGNLLIADFRNHRIRRVSPDGTISTLAGTGTAGRGGDAGPAQEGQLAIPTGVAAAPDGSVFIADYGNSLVRWVTPQGLLFTVAGTGRFASTGDNGPATAAALSPLRVGIASNGALYVADPDFDRVRRLDPARPSEVSASAGGSQSGTTGQRLAQPLQVRVAAQGQALPGVPVTFTVTSGTATVSPAVALSDAQGIASTVVTLGNTPGPVTVTATIPGLPAVTFALTVSGVSAPAPRIREGGVVGGGRSTPAVTAISPNGRVLIFGENLAAVEAGGRGLQAADLVGGRAPVRLAGTCVRIGRELAPVLYVAADVVSAQVPSGVVPGDLVPVRVITGCGTANERASNAITVPVQRATPEFLYAALSPDGTNPVLAADASGTVAITDANPARAGQEVVVYVTGLGATNPALVAGELPAGAVPLAATATVTLGGQTLAADQVLFVGTVAQEPGLYVVRLRVPASAQPGNLALTIRVSGVSSPAGAYLPVR